MEESIVFGRMILLVRLVSNNAIDALVGKKRTELQLNDISTVHLMYLKLFFIEVAFLRYLCGSVAILDTKLAFYHGTLDHFSMHAFVHSTRNRPFRVAKILTTTTPIAELYQTKKLHSSTFLCHNEFAQKQRKFAVARECIFISITIKRPNKI